MDFFLGLLFKFLLGSRDSQKERPQGRAKSSERTTAVLIWVAVRLAFDILTGMSSHVEQGSLFAKHEIFTPMKTFPPLTVRELAGMAPGDTEQGAA